MTVTLCESDQELAREIAKARHEYARENNIRDLRRADDPHFIDLNGFGGELAVCRFFYVEPDLEIGTNEERDNPHTDLVLDGKSVDIKTTKYKTGNLIARKIHEEVDIYILVRGKFPTYEIAGWITREDFEAAGKRDLGRGPTHFFHAEQLNPIEDLL